MTTSNRSPVARASMLIRRPVADVFEAFTSADTLTKFWLSRASGPLEEGKRVSWEFMVKGATVETFVERFERNTRIDIRWSDETKVTWSFEARPDSTTKVTVENWGIGGDLEESMNTALEATQGFTIVLCDAKTLLEGGVSANLVRDKALLIQEQIDARQ